MFSHPSLAVQHQDMVNIFSPQAALNPIKNILTTKEHAGLDNGCSGNIGIEYIVHYIVLALGNE